MVAVPAMTLAMLRLSDCGEQACTVTTLSVPTILSQLSHGLLHNVATDHSLGLVAQSVQATNTSVPVQHSPIVASLIFIHIIASLVFSLKKQNTPVPV